MRYSIPMKIGAALSAALLFVGTFETRVSAMAEIGTLNFNSDGKIQLTNVAGSVLDARNGFAYAGTDRAIVKVGLSPYRRVDSIFLNPTPSASGFNTGVTAATLDPATNLAYFGFTPNPAIPAAQILKVNVDPASSFALVGSPLTVPESALSAALMDSVNGYAYFTGQKAVYQINLRTFSVEHTFAMNSGEQILSAIMNPSAGIMYVASPGEVVQIQVPSGGSGFRRGATLTIGSNVWLQAAGIDTPADVAYFVDSNDKMLYQIQLNSLSVSSQLALTGNGLPMTIAVDSARHKAYLGCFFNGAPALVERVDTSATPPVMDGAVSLNLGGPGFLTSLIDTSGSVYFGASTNPIQLWKCDPTSFSFVDHVNFAVAVQSIIASLVDSGHRDMFFLTHQDAINYVPTVAVKVNLTNFSAGQTLTLSMADFGWPWVADPASQLAYIGTINSPSKIIKVDLTNMTPVTSLTLPTDATDLNLGDIDTIHHFAYFLGVGSGKIVKVNVDPVNFSLVGTFPVANGSLASAMVVDPAGQKAYCAIGASPSNFVEIDLQSGQQVNKSSNFSDTFNSGFLDSQNGDVYFVGGNQLAKIHLADFSIRVLSTKSAFETFEYGQVDITRAYAYVLLHYQDSATAYEAVTQIHLPDLTRGQTLKLDSSVQSPRTIVMDPAGGMGYIGTQTIPAKVVQFSSDPAGAGGSAPAITSALSASGDAGTTFRYQMTASNNPTSFDATGLPNGLSVNTVTGLISGTPSSPGTSSITLSATNASGTGSATLTLTIAPTLSITTPSPLPDGAIGSAYAQSLSASGGSAPYLWSLAAGNLPAGLSLDANSGVISGTPTIAATNSFTVNVTDGEGAVATKTFPLAILNQIAPPVITAANATVSGLQVFFVANATDPQNEGLLFGWDFGDGTLSAQTNDFSATIAHTYLSAGTYRAILTVTNASGKSASQGVTVTISASWGGSIPFNATSVDDTVVVPGRPSCNRSNSELRLYDLQGRRVKTLASGECLDSKDLPAAAYRAVAKGGSVDGKKSTWVVVH